MALSTRIFSCKVPTVDFCVDYCNRKLRSFGHLEALSGKHCSVDSGSTCILKSVNIMPRVTSATYRRRIFEIL